jgi:hypothetical protein
LSRRVSSPDEAIEVAAVAPRGHVGQAKLDPVLDRLPPGDNPYWMVTSTQRLDLRPHASRPRSVTCTQAVFTSSRREIRVLL